MTIRFISILTGIVLYLNSYCQDSRKVDSLNKILVTSSDDTLKGQVIWELCQEFVYTKPDSCLYYGALGFDLIRNPITRQQFESSNNFDLHYFEASMYYVSAIALSEQRSDSLAIEMGLRALQLTEKLKNKRGLLREMDGKGEFYQNYAFEGLGEIYQNIGEPIVALDYFKRALALDESEQDKQLRIASIGACFYDLGQYDSALYYLNKIDPEIRIGNYLWPYPDTYLGNTYAKKGEYLKAISFYKSSIRKSIENPSPQDLSQAYAGLSSTFKSLGQIDSGIVYANLSLHIADKNSFPNLSLQASDLLTSLYESKGLIDSAFKYQKISNTLKDTILNKEKIKQVQSFTFIEKLRQKDVDQEKAQYQNQVNLYTLLAVLTVMITVAIFLIRNNRQKQKANVVLETTLFALKSTQSQLIQSAKMASLGELTAGIAHEIQNPLNFVNNFSEVNADLLHELAEGPVKNLSGTDKADAEDIIHNLSQNMDKINFHGQRADSIVKSMLQHSGSRGGQKEMTDINALADEYLRLAYHGLRAREKSFNCTLQTDFDLAIGNIDIIPQDIGRVLLNLYNNAFFAVNEKMKTADETYVPTVRVSTQVVSESANSLIRNSLIISVKDNGIGIPEKVRDKIFQPFFTTKPAGKGTGLGLSLSYDIIKAHGGEIKVETKEGEGSEFIILLDSTFKN